MTYDMAGLETLHPFLLLGWLALIYILLVFFIRVFINIFGAVYCIHFYRKQIPLDIYPRDSLYPGVSILVPAYNESHIIVDTIANLLSTDYPKLEVIVINDGSTDDTHTKIDAKYHLNASLRQPANVLACQPITTIEYSSIDPRLTVVHKLNGRKSDALNAGLNVSRYDIFCCVDADGFLQHNAIRECIQAYLNDDNVVGVGCGLRVMEGAEIQRVQNPKNSEQTTRKLLGGVSSHWLAGFQTLEYLQSFLLDRMAWSGFKSVQLLSGAFVMYKKNIVVEAGGYNSHCIGDDSEMTLRVHRHMALVLKQPYQLVYLPYPLCWTQVPKDPRSLFNQRRRWQRGALNGFWKKPLLLFNRENWVLGWLSMPYLLAINLIFPAIQVSAFVICLVFFVFIAALQMAYGEFAIVFDWQQTIQIVSAVVLVGYSFSVLQSAFTILIDQLTFNSYSQLKDKFKLLIYAFLKPIGYAQWVWLARLSGLYLTLIRSRVTHGKMIRHSHILKKQELV
ncbi:MAG: glycosyltransferase [Cyanobacteria bacterium P01_H01_bin.74]